MRWCVRRHLSDLRVWGLLLLRCVSCVKPTHTQKKKTTHPRNPLNTCDSNGWIRMVHPQPFQPAAPLAELETIQKLANVHTWDFRGRRDWEFKVCLGSSNRILGAFPPYMIYAKNWQTRVLPKENFKPSSLETSNEAMGVFHQSARGERVWWPVPVITNANCLGYSFLTFTSLGCTWQFHPHLEENNSSANQIS